MTAGEGLLPVADRAQVRRAALRLVRADGKVAASGPHRRLLAEEPGYRALVARDVDAEDAEGVVR
ncbi:hypothetical protein ACIHEJ_39970 [Streptomyces sp. NPDC052301]|uniref:hypothetical protein n=1 Tax=Streptomyces sp. NPDC052301 TaxID=3365687 RepID=UPI0037D1BA6C